MAEERIYPIYLVKGDDLSLVSQSLESLVDKLTGGDSLATETLGMEADLAAAVESLQTPSLFGDLRVVVISEVGRFDAEQSTPLVSYLADPNPGSVAVIVAGGGVTSRRLTDAVRKYGHVIDASRPSKARDRADWLSQRIAESPVKLNAGAVKSLSAHLGEDLARLMSLLGGLAAAYGEGAVIGEDELAPFLGDAGGVAPWDLTDAIDSGDVGAGLVALNRMLDAGQRHPLAVLATLSRHILALMKLDGSGVRSDSDAAGLLGTAPFPARKALSQSRKLGSVKVARAVKLVAQADLDLRGAAEWPPTLVLEVLVARLARL